MKDEILKFLCLQKDTAAALRVITADVVCVVSFSNASTDTAILENKTSRATLYENETSLCER